LTVIIQSVAPKEPHQLTLDSAALIYLYDQSLAPAIAKALLANKASRSMGQDRESKHTSARMTVV
jgi:hypothetical protein